MSLYRTPRNSIFAQGPQAWSGSPSKKGIVAKLAILVAVGVNLAACNPEAAVKGAEQGLEFAKVAARVTDREAAGLKFVARGMETRGMAIDTGSQAAVRLAHPFNESSETKRMIGRCGGGTGGLFAANEFTGRRVGSDVPFYAGAACGAAMGVTR